MLQDLDRLRVGERPLRRSTIALRNGNDPEHCWTDHVRAVGIMTP
jgi:hypothetical protein